MLKINKLNAKIDNKEILKGFSLRILNLEKFML